MMIKMITKILIMILALTSTYFPLEAGVWDKVRSVFAKPEPQKPPTIKVLIVHDADAATLEVKGPYNIYDPYKNTRLGTRFVGKRNLIQPLSDGLKWGEAFPGIYQIVVVPDDPHFTTLVNGIEYRGLMYVYDIAGNISIVNEVDIEDYLSSVLSQEITNPKSEEALAAAAITARTNVYHLATTASNPYWHVDGSKMGYEGFAITNRTDGIEKAIASTRYMVMSKTTPYEKGISPFPTQIVQQPTKRRAASSLFLDEAEAMAQQGSHAANILSKSFPNTNIALTHRSAEPTKEIADISTEKQ